MGILSQALHSFKRDDAELAKQTMKLTHQTIPQFNDVLDALVEEQSKREITDLFALFVVFHHFVRVSDLSKKPRQRRFTGSCLSMRTMVA